MGVDSFPPPGQLPPPPATSYVRELYRNAHARLRALRLLLASTALAVGGFEALGVRALLLEDGSTAEGLQAAEHAVAAGSLATWCWMGACVALAVWTGRMYRNLFALGVEELRFTPGWGVGAWFVPLLNFVRPKQIIDDTWRATSPGAMARGWRELPVPATLHVWWGLALLSWLSAPYTNGEPADRARLGWTLLGAVPVVVSCRADLDRGVRADGTAGVGRRPPRPPRPGEMGGRAARPTLFGAGRRCRLLPRRTRRGDGHRVRTCDRGLEEHHRSTEHPSGLASARVAAAQAVEE